ncbi:MAG: TetR family transcriptional regulator [Actinomycetota bacterium]
MSCGRRERKKAETRDRLADAALRLALAHGPDEVTVEQIAAEADVSPRTFFNYFPSKWDAIVDFDPSEKEEFAAAVAARPAGEAPLEALRQAFLERHDAQGEQFAEMRSRMELVEQHDVLNRRFLEYFAMFEQRLVDAVAARLGVDPADDPYPGLLVAAVTASIRTTFHRYAEDQSQGSFVEVFDAAFSVLASGFAPPDPQR